MRMRSRMTRRTTIETRVFGLSMMAFCIVSRRHNGTGEGQPASLKRRSSSRRRRRSSAKLWLKSSAVPTKMKNEPRWQRIMPSATRKWHEWQRKKHSGTSERLRASVRRKRGKPSISES
jgi:hypothetical protein